MTFSIHDALAPLAGGALIGAAVSLLYLTHGKIAGVSGFVGRALMRRSSDRALAISFMVGLFVAGLALRFVYPSAFAIGAVAPLPVIAVAGLLVGYGTRLGNGCTSGHGVCGNARLSVRSMIATVTFIATGAATVFVTRHVLGGAQ
jgi:uncharacterized protein